MSYFVADISRTRIGMSAYGLAAGAGITAGIGAQRVFNPEQAPANEPNIKKALMPVALGAMLVGALYMRNSATTKSAPCTAAILATSVGVGVAASTSLRTHPSDWHLAEAEKQEAQAREAEAQRAREEEAQNAPEAKAPEQSKTADYFLDADQTAAQEATLKTAEDKSRDELKPLIAKRDAGKLAGESHHRYTALEPYVTYIDELAKIPAATDRPAISRGALNDKIRAFSEVKAYRDRSWTLHTGEIRGSSFGYRTIEDAAQVAKLTAKQLNYGALIVKLDDRFFVTKPSTHGDYSSIDLDSEVDDIFNSLGLASRRPIASEIVGISSVAGELTLY